MTDKPQETDKPQNPEPKHETKVVAGGQTIRIESPEGGSHHKPRISVIVSPDEVVHGFVGFLRGHAIVGLAVGFVVGAQVQTLIKQLITSFIDPLFKLFFGQGLNERTFTLRFSGHSANFGWGVFVYTLLDFLFVLAVIYGIIKMFNLDKLDTPPKA